MMGIARRLSQERGIMLIEVVVAAVVLSVGILALISGFDSAQKLTLTAERRASLTHLAQREIERLQAVPYEEVAMISKPEHSTVETSPDFYVDYSGATCGEVAKDGCYSWNANEPKEAEAIAVAQKGTRCPTVLKEPISPSEEGCGVVSASPSGIACNSLNPFGSCEWSDGSMSGDIYDFVTWHYDRVCREATEKAETVCTEQSYKRISVVVTVNVPSSTHLLAPVRVSTMIANPASVKPSPLANPQTKCGTVPKACIGGIGRGNARSWFLHDSSAEKDEASAEVPTPSKANAETDPTVAPSKATSCEASEPYKGCPRPDFMDATAPTGETLYDYSPEQDLVAGEDAYTYGEKEFGGRRLERSTECNAAPPSGGESSENFQSELWVSEPLAEEAKLTAAGGLSIYTQTIGGVTAPDITLCLAVYSVPKAIDDLWMGKSTEEPEELAYTSYTPAEWPGAMQPVNFVFEPEGEHPLISELSTSKGLSLQPGEAIVPAEHRIGLRIWLATTSTRNISIAYDTAAQPSLLQLNTE